MAKRKRRTPRYKREDPVFLEQQAKKEAGFPPDAVVADLSQQVANGSSAPTPTALQRQGG